ncbi:hypothetical protein SCLCIDRAFT_1217107 [Scleroderma citrinum Foug A]|uniref:Uncharacterized protein n=1 Tax=Scleroderma citrinum Foug A TaxID=1036808 RepID=A0A0C3A5U8_9AGAM|nr:hypothetical protein SCLCIDRAFT_1217107 [Scleroderma citrinum Foug A]
MESSRSAGSRPRCQRTSQDRISQLNDSSEVSWGIVSQSASSCRTSPSEEDGLPVIVNLRMLFMAGKSGTMNGTRSQCRANTVGPTCIKSLNQPTILF